MAHPHCELSRHRAEASPARDSEAAPPPRPTAGASPPPWPGTLAPLLGLWSLAVVQPLLQLMASHPTFLVAQGYGPLAVALLPWCLTWLPPTLLAAGVTSLAMFHGGGARLAWKILLGTLSGVLVLAGAVQGSLSTWTCLLLAAFAASALAWLEGRRAVRSFLGLLGLAAFVVPAAFLADTEVRRLWLPAPGEVPLTADLPPWVADGPPVVVLILDELASLSLLSREGRLDEDRFPGFARLTRLAAFFPRTRAAADTTEQAVPAMLTGVAPRATRVPVAREHPINLFTILGTGYRVRARESLTRLCPPRLNLARSRVRGLERWARRLDDLRLVYLHRVLPSEWRRGLPPLEDRWEDFGLPASRRRLLRAVGARTRGDRPELFDAWLREIRAGAGPELHFLHLLLPHRPWEYLPDGRRYRLAGVPGLDGSHWQDRPFLVAQAHQRYLWQLQYLDSLIGRLLDHLEAEALLEPSLLVVMADHGAGFQPAEARRLLTAGNVEEIAVVPLWIKPPEGQGLPPREGTVRAVDLFPTILDLLGWPLPEALDGRSLAGPTAGPRRPDRFFAQRIATGNTPAESWLRQGSLTLPPDLDQRFDRRLVLQGPGGSDPLGPYRRGPAGALVGRPLEELEVGDAAAWRLRGLRLGEPPRRPGSGPRLFQGALQPLGRRQPCCRLAFVVNGRVWATTETWKVRGPHRAFSVFLPPEAGAGEVSTIRVFQIGGPGRQPTLHPVQAPPTRR